MIEIAGRANLNLRRTAKGVSRRFDEKSDDYLVMTLWQIFGIDADFEIYDQNRTGSAAASGSPV